MFGLELTVRIEAALAKVLTREGCGSALTKEVVRYGADSPSAIRLIVEALEAADLTVYASGECPVCGGKTKEGDRATYQGCDHVTVTM